MIARADAERLTTRELDQALRVLLGEWERRTKRAAAQRREAARTQRLDRVVITEQQRLDGRRPIGAGAGRPASPGGRVLEVVGRVRRILCPCGRVFESPRRRGRAPRHCASCATLPKGKRP